MVVSPISPWMETFTMRYFGVAAVITAVLLSGCYSPNGLKEQGPTFSADTKKTPKQYALCVFPQWQESRPDSTMSETQTGYRLLSGNDMNTNELLEVTKSQVGSSVKLYQRNYLDFGSGKEKARASTRSCL